MVDSKEPITIDMVSPTEETPQYYVNFLEVNATPNELSIRGGRVPAKITPEMGDPNNVIRLDPQLELIIPLTLVESFINILANAWKESQGE